MTDVITYKPQRRNANRHTQRGMSALEQSVQADGWIGAITVAADDETFDGSARIETAAATGFDDPIVVESDGTRPVVVRRIDIPTADDPRAVRLGLAANRVAELNLDWDTTVLADLGANIDLSQFWTRDELAGLLEQEIVIGGGGDDFDTTPDEGPTRVQPGELWQLGEHRLLCGDSTKAEDVARLMGGEQAMVMVTDPPYAVDYVDKARDMNSRGYVHSRATLRAAIQGDGIEAGQEDVLWRDAFQRAFDLALLPHAAIYIWHAPGRAMLTLYNLLAEMKVLHHQTIIWVKNNFVIGRCDYQWIHEPCFYGWRQGQRPPFYGAKNQTTVWDIARDTVAPLHATQKPVAIMLPPIENHTKPNEIVYDPFFGSGTTLIAAQRTGRRCFGCEIDPHNADVIIKRYEVETGLTAVRVDV